MDMGKDFVKKIKPVGIVMILLFSIVGTYMMFTFSFDIPPRYESIHTTDYYRQNAETIQELHTELQEFVFPSIDGILESSVLPDQRMILIHVSSEHHDKVKAIILRDFDEELFVFRR